MTISRRALLFQVFAALDRPRHQLLTLVESVEHDGTYKYIHLVVSGADVRIELLMAGKATDKTISWLAEREGKVVGWQLVES